jgi:hypothetical protein
MDFLDGLEARTAMMTISKNVKLGEKDANNGRIGVSFKKHDFSDFFYRTSFFFIAIRLRICGGGSAPHFAANAALKYTCCIIQTNCKLSNLLQQ